VPEPLLFVGERGGECGVVVDAAARPVVELDPLVGSGVFEYRLYEWRGGPLRR